MRMEVYLRAYGLWDAVVSVETQRKKDQLAHSACTQVCAMPLFTTLILTWQRARWHWSGN